MKNLTPIEPTESQKKHREESRQGDFGFFNPNWHNSHSPFFDEPKNEDLYSAMSPDLLKIDFSRFLEDIRIYSFNDPKLINLVHSLAQKTKISNFSNFFGEDIDYYDFEGEFLAIEPGYGDILKKAHESFLQLVNMIKRSLYLVEQSKEILETYEQFSDVEKDIENAQKALSYLKNISIRFDDESGYASIYLNENGEDTEVFMSEKINPFVVKKEFLKKAGFAEIFKHIIALAKFVAYSLQAGEESGVFPVIKSSQEGLSLCFKNVVHPIGKIMRKCDTPEIVDPDAEPEKMVKRVVRGDTEGTLKEVMTPAYLSGVRGAPEDEKRKKEKISFYKDVQKFLEKNGFLSHFLGERYDWLPYTQRKDVEVAIQESLENSSFSQAIKDQISKNLLASYDKERFVPVPEFSLDANSPVFILTGANGNGKSTFMKSIAYAVHFAMQGRKVNATEAEVTMCDRIFSDFNLSDNLSSGVSTFRAQIQTVVDFLENGTPNSLGLFDELYHGTNSTYQLALTWATLEEFKKQKLRVIVSTHEQAVSLLGQKNGYDVLRGKYHIPYFLENSTDENSKKPENSRFKNISIGEEFSLDYNPNMDSDAFAIAEEENLPDSILKRAKEVYDHLTSST